MSHQHELFLCLRFLLKNLFLQALHIPPLTLNKKSFSEQKSDDYHNYFYRNYSFDSRTYKK